jgi:hypothetical protein
MNKPHWLHMNVNSQRGKQHEERQLDSSGATFRDDEWVVDVTEVARRVFGDVIRHAEQVICDEEVFTFGAEKAKQGIAEETTQLNLRYGKVVLYFTNGRRVVIHSSEWGTIS